MDNPQVLEQQLEALEHHKKVLERREQYQKMLQDQGYSMTKPKETTGSISSAECGENLKSSSNIESNYSNAVKAMGQSPHKPLNTVPNFKYDQIIYSNLTNENIPRDTRDNVHTGLLRTERMPQSSGSFSNKHYSLQRSIICIFSFEIIYRLTRSSEPGQFILQRINADNFGKHGIFNKRFLANSKSLLKLSFR